MRRRIRKGEKSQSLVEFSLLIPIFLILVFGIIDFGMGLRSYITVTQATREGARYGAVGNPRGTFTAGGAGECNGSTTTTVVGRVCSTMSGLQLSNVTAVNVTYPAGQTPGNSIRVNTQYNYDLITPLDAIMNFISAGSMSGTLNISTTTDMRLE
jgi:Flp pilus assembly protein TadG